MRRSISFFDILRFIIAFLLFVILYAELEIYFLKGFQGQENTLSMHLKKLFLVEGLGSFLSLFISLLLISNRFKVVAGTLIMSISLLFYLVFIVILDPSHTWILFAVNTVGLSFLAIGTSIAILIWMLIKSKIKNRDYVSKAKTNRVKTLPKTSFILILLSLFSVPVAYVSLIISAFVTLGISLSALELVLQLPRVPVVVLVAIGSAPLVSLWIAFQAIRAVFFSNAEFQPVVRIDLSKNQRLRAVIQEVCSKINTRMPDVTLLHVNPTFFVADRKLETFDGLVNGRILTLGAPLMRHLSLDELKVILAHEFAHFSGRDTLYSRFVVPVYRSVGTAINDISGMAESNEGKDNVANLVNILLFVPGFFLRIFLAYFSTIDNMLSRSRELRADWIASSSFGSNNMASGLTKVTEISKHYNDNASVEEIAKEGQNFFEKYDEMLINDKYKLEEYRQQALLETEHEFDTHPTLSTRLDSLPYNQLSQENNSIMIEELRAELKDDETRLSACYQQMVKNYKEHQELIQKAKQEFALLNETQNNVVRSLVVKFREQLKLGEQDIVAISAYLVNGGEIDNKFEVKAINLLEMIKSDAKDYDIFVIGGIIRIALFEKYGLTKNRETIKKLFSDLGIDLTPYLQKEMPTLDAYVGMAQEFCKKTQA